MKPKFFNLEILFFKPTLNLTRDPTSANPKHVYPTSALVGVGSFWPTLEIVKTH